MVAHVFALMNDGGYQSSSSLERGELVGAIMLIRSAIHLRAAVDTAVGTTVVGAFVTEDTFAVTSLPPDVAAEDPAALDNRRAHYDDPEYWFQPGAVWRAAVFNFAPVYCLCARLRPYAPSADGARLPLTGAAFPSSAKIGAGGGRDH